MLGMAATRPTSVRDLLLDAPRCLRNLSEQHADGWGLALRRDDTWTIRKSTTCAARCADYASLELDATLAIAHIRKKTVGELALENTHPFRRGDFVFAHNGTVDTAAIVAATPPRWSATLEGTTDSEKLFMFLLTHIDRAGEAGIEQAVRALHGLGAIGSASFLLSYGARLYAHRLNRALFTARREGVAMIASEPLTDLDHWTEVPERSLVVLDGGTAELLAAA
ncbi:MAG: class II glutamine amidotransferase [Kofleriaceae bacterium]